MTDDRHVAIYIQLAEPGLADEMQYFRDHAEESGQEVIDVLVEAPHPQTGELEARSFTLQQFLALLGFGSGSVN